ncbi:SEL1-like repeat protein [Helicobacter pylori]|nr:SEL1-like repeat protein [Helicobacter pylori]
MAFIKKFEKLEDFKTDFHTNAKISKMLSMEDIAEISSNIISLKQQMGEILYRIGIAYQEGLGTRKQKSRAKKFLQKSAEFGYEKASSVVF